ncbi:MAG: hypothetical protein J1E39_02040 [Eubacterium sp.]|nr:hypothetical protein [Eubacterium sp.]
MDVFLYILVILVVVVPIVIIVIDSKRLNPYRKEKAEFKQLAKELKAFSKKSRKSNTEKDIITQGIADGQKKRDIIFEAQKPEDDTYGYSKNNPICTSGIESSEKYLSRLRTLSGEAFTWKRNGSLTLENYCSLDYIIIDEYQLFLNNKPHKIIYICPYGHNSKYSPLGMQLISLETGLHMKENHLPRQENVNSLPSFNDVDNHALYSLAYRDAYNILKQSDLVHNIEFELLPILYVLVDYVGYVLKKRELSNDALNWISSAIDDFHYYKDEFNKRVDFYVEFIRGKVPFMNWSPVDAPKESLNDPLFRCVAAFGDVIYNPACIDNYDDAPLLINGIFDQFNFTNKIMKPTMKIFEQFVDLLNLKISKQN